MCQLGRYSSYPQLKPLTDNMALLVPILRAVKGLSTIDQSGGSPVFAGETASRPTFDGFNEAYANRLKIPLALVITITAEKMATGDCYKPKE